MLAPWIISHMPAHRIYVEPFCGAASVLLRKKRCYSEVISDKDEEVINLFQMARDRGDELREVLRLTPFARAEFVRAWEPSENPLEQARRTVIRAYMGFGSAAVTKVRHITTARGGAPSTGFRAQSNKSGTTPAHDWRNFPNALPDIIERLRGVVIESRDALEIIPQHDTAETLFYVDPPYVAATRDAGGDYRHELTDDDHRKLAEVLRSVCGMVMLSGYPSALYGELYHDWRRIDRAAFADGAARRTECLWLNAAAVSASNHTPDLIAA